MPCIRRCLLPSAARNRGFSLVELMVAITIGLIITIAVAQVFLQSQATYRVDEGLARAQENGRFAVEFVSRELRHAGYYGCRAARGKRDIKTEDGQFHGWDLYSAARFDITPMLAIPLNGIEAPGTAPGNTILAGATVPTAPAAASIATAAWGGPIAIPNGGILPGTDAITLLRINPVGIQLAPPFLDIPDFTSVFVDHSSAALSGLTAGDTLFMTDCKVGALFRVSQITTAGATDTLLHDASMNRCPNWLPPTRASGNAATANCTGFVMDPARAELSRLEFITYYIGVNSNNVPGLFMWRTGPDWVGPAQELVEGVENMQILYGEDTALNADGSRSPRSADRYVPASLVANWANVVSARIAFLVRSQNASLTGTEIGWDPTTFNLLGTTVGPINDTQRRRVFTTTVQLRNR